MKSEVLHLCNWATTHRGTPIELYQKTHTGQAPWLFIGGVHGDEPEGVILGQSLARWLTDEEKQSPLKNSWILIPCLNPDGFSSLQRTNSRGVDLNRNFPTHDWTSESRGPRYSPGSAPGSENETQALVQLIQQTRPEVIFHFHSWIPSIVYTGEDGRPWADFFENAQYPAQPDIGYPTPGSLGQYGWYQHKVPVICIEEKAGVSLDTVWSHFESGFRRMFHR